MSKRLDGADDVGGGTDSELMLRVRGGDLYALGLLFVRYQAKVHAWCFRLTDDRHTADDLVQDTFLRILRYRHAFSGDAAFSTWLYRIARNVCLDHLANLRRNSDAQEQLHGRAAAETGPAAAYEDGRLAILDAALMRLPIEKREVLVLSRYHDLRYEDIAQVCNCSVGAVKARVHRAIRHLRDLYNELECQDNEMRDSERTDSRRSHG